MSLSEGCAFCGGCAICAAAVCWWVCGGIALSAAYEYAEGCGWWLWGAFIGELIYVPFAILFSCVYLCGALVSLTSHEELSTDSACVDGFGRAVVFVLLNFINVAILGTSGYAIWNEDCIAHDSWLYAMSRVGFWICAVLTGMCVLAGITETCKVVVHKCSDTV